MKEINYFDTPADRWHGGGMADFMDGVLSQRARDREEVLTNVPTKYTNLQELKEIYGNTKQNSKGT